MDYLYDGTYDGFLTCVHDHYYVEKADGIYLEWEYQQNLTRRFQVVATDQRKADKVYDAIEKRFSAYDARRIYRVFLSGTEDKEMKALNYIRLGFTYKDKDVGRLHGHPIVKDFEVADRQVTREMDRMYGLVRFEYLKGNVAYARIEPDNDLLELIAWHFCDRFKSEAFIIHDQKRHKALISYGGMWYIQDFDERQLPELSEDEKQYQRLWKEYFTTIAIKERTNPRCQRNMMPARYWKNLTEMQ